MFNCVNQIFNWHDYCSLTYRFRRSYLIDLHPTYLYNFTSQQDNGYQMALKGNLRDFTITQLLNLINLAGKTGTLVIEGSANVAKITFREGKLVYAQMDHLDNSLAGILRRSKKITARQYTILSERAANMSDKELGILLINAGYLNQYDIIESLQQYFISIVRQLFTWVDGFFNFQVNSLPPPDKIPIRMDLENLIIEGSRQIREWEQLQQEIPSLDMSLKFSERPGINIRNITLSVEEWRVVYYVNPKNTMRQIAKATKLNDLEIRRIVFSLLQAGLVEIIRPGEKPMPAAKPRTIPVVPKKEQKSLINRIIDRIRTI